MFRELAHEIHPYRYYSNRDRVETCQNTLSNNSVSREESNIGLSIAVLNLNSFDLLSNIIRGYDYLVEIFGNHNKKIELLIGDTGSRDKRVLELLRTESKRPNVKIYWNMKYHFAKNNNELSRKSLYNTLLFLNNDCLISDNPQVIFDNFCFISSNPSIGAVSPLLTFPDGKIQHMGIDFLLSPTHRNLGYHYGYKRQTSFFGQEPVEVRALSGACFFVRREIFEGVGGFDEDYAIESQDTALSLDIVRFYPNKKIVVTNYGKLTHLENGTRKKGEWSDIDRSLFLRRYSSFIEAKWR